MTLDPPESHLRWIERRERSLRDPDGWLALVALHWLPPGTSTICAVGETTGDRLVLPGALASPAVTFELEAPRLLVVQAGESPPPSTASRFPPTHRWNCAMTERGRGRYFVSDDCTSPMFIASIAPHSEYEIEKPRV